MRVFHWHFMVEKHLPLGGGGAVLSASLGTRDGCEMVFRHRRAGKFSQAFARAPGAAAAGGGPVGRGESAEAVGGQLLGIMI